MSQNLRFARDYAWSLAKTLMVCITLFKTDSGYGVLPSDELDGDPASVTNTILLRADCHPSGASGLPIAAEHPASDDREIEVIDDGGELGSAVNELRCSDRRDLWQGAIVESDIGFAVQPRVVDDAVWLGVVRPKCPRPGPSEIL